MLYLKLFFTFLKIGAFTFGGGYAMIPLISESVVQNGWLKESEFLNFLAVSESTPGPIAINMATFVGSSQAGFFGGVCATLGVVLPSFVIILLICAVMKNFLKYSTVKGFMSGVRPCVVALIIAAGIKIALSTLFSFSNAGDTFQLNYREIIIFFLIAVIAMFYKRFREKRISPIFLIIISALMGIGFYSLT